MVSALGPAAAPNLREIAPPAGGAPGPHNDFDEPGSALLLFARDGVATSRRDGDRSKSADFERYDDDGKGQQHQPGHLSVDHDENHGRSLTPYAVNGTDPTRPSTAARLAPDERTRPKGINRQTQRDTAGSRPQRGEDLEYEKSSSMQHTDGLMYAGSIGLDVVGTTGPRFRFSCSREMQVPRMLLGRTGEVKRRVAPLVKAFAAGASLGELDFGEMMSSSEAPAAFFALNPGRIASSRLDFHCYAFFCGVLEAETKGRVDREQFDAAFGWSLQQPWSFLGTISEAGSVFFLKMDRAAFIKEPPPEVLRGRPEWYAQFLSAALRHWDTLADEGQRYTPAPSALPREFPRVAYTIVHVLGYMGVVKTATDVDTPAKVLHAVQRAVAQLQS